MIRETGHGIRVQRFMNKLSRAASLTKRLRHRKANFLDKDFCFWDGEGEDHLNNPLDHRYILLSNSDGEYIEDREGLSTEKCLEFLLQQSNKKIHVWFFFGYDVNMILKDIPLHKQKKWCCLSSRAGLYEGYSIYYKGYKIRYIVGKFFSIYKNKKFFRSCDTSDFYQTSLINALKAWGIEVPEALVKGKEARGSLQDWPLYEIRQYNTLELVLSKQLIEKTRQAFKAIGLPPRSWHGPGAVAERFFDKYRAKPIFGNPVEGMKIPVRHALFGARIDIAGIGETRAFLYDIASAYPSAFTNCISLEDAGWRLREPIKDDIHALYHVTWEIKEEISWGPFPWRKENGSILFPRNGEGWYWGIEVLAADRLFPGKIKRIEAWYPINPKRYPLKPFIEMYYKNRLKVGKKTGQGIAYKLILNSFYGKLCQSVGEHKWQNFIWAGFITAYTRAKMLDVINEVGQENVVAIATDGIYTKKPLSGSYVSNPPLGSWEYKEEAKMLIAGAGLNIAFYKDGTYDVKHRGFASTLNYAWILRQWGCITSLNMADAPESFTATKHQFIGMGRAIHQHKPVCCWIEEEKTIEDIRVKGTSKRIPPYTIVEEPWLFLPLLIRDRPPGSQMLSMIYTPKRAKHIKEDKKMKNEI